MLAHNEPNPTNTQAPRALDCIYLRPSAGDSGHDLLHLQTNAIVNLRNLTPMPVTSSIIKQVHDMAVMDKIPKGLKITNKTGNILIDSAQIAGVNYTNDEDTRNDSNSDQNDTSDSDEDRIIETDNKSKR